MPISAREIARQCRTGCRPKAELRRPRLAADALGMRRVIAPALLCLAVFSPGCTARDTAARGNDLEDAEGGEGDGGLATTEQSTDDDDDRESDDGASHSSQGGGGGETGDGTTGDGSDESSGGVVETGEAGVCGDGIVDPGESCDDADGKSGDGCESDCTRTVGVFRFSTGGAHTCAIDYEGRVRCFGENGFGQLGYGHTFNLGDVDTPVESDAFVDIGGYAVSIESGEDHTCALTVAGEVYCWGRNDRGQLGYGDELDVGDDPGETPQTYGPVDVGATAVAIATGRAHTCALLADGDLRCWGEGNRGQLGLGGGFDGTVGQGKDPYRRPISTPPIAWADDQKTRDIFAAGDFSCVVSLVGDVHCWGGNDDGQLGLSSTAEIGIEEHPSKAGAALLDNPISTVALGHSHACGISQSGTVRCWGGADYGQLGYGSTETYGDDEPPFDGIVHMGGITAISLSAGLEFSCALLFDGTVRCWGRSDEGQLGYGSTETVGDDEFPADWEDFGAIKVLERATSISSGRAHTCARTDDARLHCWGRGAEGQLGYGSTDNVGDDLADLPIGAVPVFKNAP